MTTQKRTRPKQTIIVDTRPTKEFLTKTDYFENFGLNRKITSRRRARHMPTIMRRGLPQGACRSPPPSSQYMHRVIPHFASPIMLVHCFRHCWCPVCAYLWLVNDLIVDASLHFETAHCALPSFSIAIVLFASLASAI